MDIIFTCFENILIKILKKDIYLKEVKSSIYDNGIDWTFGFYLKNNDTKSCIFIIKYAKCRKYKYIYLLNELLTDNQFELLYKFHEISNLIFVAQYSNTCNYINFIKKKEMELLINFNIFQIINMYKLKLPKNIIIIIYQYISLKKFMNIYNYKLFN
jgi:hypothetical protein